MWNCTECPTENEDYLHVCSECGTERPNEPRIAASTTAERPAEPEPVLERIERLPIPDRPCAECGSAAIVGGIKVCQSVEAGCTGLEFTAKWILRGTECLLADLCEQCGTVQRFRVKEPHRRWILG